MTYTNYVYVQCICDFIKNVIGEKTDVIVSGYSGSFVIMACRNEEKLFNKIMMVNPVSPGVLKQMPTKKDKIFLQVSGSSGIWYSGLPYGCVQSRDQ